MPTTVPNEPNHSLLHFHVCIHCGSAFRREEFEGRAITSGILPCTKCGAEGPLNIEIRETDKSAFETQALATK
jgi:translation initiation factor 2 beta subunit (eIF-2beta)/eIF-5